MDASIARRADIEYLYDRPYEDRTRVRVAGPFTVESLSPHRAVPADEDELLDLPHAPGERRRAATPPVDFATMVLEHLRTAGIHQSRKADSIRFTSLQPWPGVYIGAEGRFLEGETERRAGILIGPEFGTLSRMDLVTAAREASETRFDVLIACAFNYDAHASELTKLGPLPLLKARMNPDLHMADDLKNTGKGNLFVVFGEPDLVVEPAPGDPDQLRIRIIGVDVFDPQTGDIRSGDTKSIAAWFIDTDYNEESFYVRHAYFLGANDPYKSLKAALRAEIDEDAWATLYRDTSRPFPRPERGRIAVKVINHFGDEVMKVFTVSPMPGYNHYPWCLCGWCHKDGRNGYSSEATEHFFDRWSANRFLSGEGVTRSFTACFVQPNATCPVCEDRVFFYANKFGSRVFFDELGWPWPKHSCTNRRIVRVLPSTIRFVPPLTRARGIRIEIADALRRADFSPLAKFVSSHGRAPPALFKIITVLRKGFLNAMEVLPISPEADVPMYIEFTSAKLIPELGAFFSFQDGRVSILDFSLIAKSFQARIIDKDRFERSITGARA
jgi:hypothetical protein